MHIKTEARRQKSCFYYPFCIVIVAWARFCPSAKSSSENIVNESVDLVFIGARKNTAPAKKRERILTDLIYIVVLNPKAFLSIDSFSEDIPKKSVSAKNEAKI